MNAHSCSRRQCPAAGDPFAGQCREPVRRVLFPPGEVEPRPPVVYPGETPEETPAQSLCERYRLLIARFLKTGFAFWKNVYGDPYRWQLFKSIMLFTVGVQLSRNLFAYMNPDKSVEKCK